MRTRASRLRALVRKEFLQLRRDPRTLGLIIGMPVVLLVVFGYAASFDVKHIPAELVGRESPLLRHELSAGGAFRMSAHLAPDVASARADLHRGSVVVAVVVGARGEARSALVDGSQLLSATTALRAIARISPGDRSRCLARYRACARANRS